MRCHSAHIHQRNTVHSFLVRLLWRKHKEYSNTTHVKGSSCFCTRPCGGHGQLASTQATTMNRQKLQEGSCSAEGDGHAPGPNRLLSTRSGHSGAFGVSGRRSGETARKTIISAPLDGIVGRIRTHLYFCPACAQSSIHRFTHDSYQYHEPSISAP